MLTFHEIAIGTGGLPSCIRCGSRDPGRHFELPSIAARLEQCADSGPSQANVVFTTFEPFAHPQLPALIATAADRGFERIRLRTDGGALSLHGNAEGAMRSGATHLEVVLLGPDDVHDRLTGRPGSFAAMEAGVRAYLAAASLHGMRVFVSAYVPLCRHNIKHAPEAVVAAATLGAGAVTLDAHGLSAAADTEALLEAAVDTGTVNLVSAWVVSYVGGLAPRCKRAVWDVV